MDTHTRFIITLRPISTEMLLSLMTVWYTEMFKATQKGHENPGSTAWEDFESQLVFPDREREKVN